MGSTVFSLFASSRPTTIFGRIRTVVVNSIKLMFWRWLAPKFGEKASVIGEFKRNASASVILPIFVVGVGAAFAGGAPRSPFWGWPIAFPITMLGVFASDSCVFGATTRLDAAAFQIRGVNDMIFAAVTTTKPMCIAAFRVGQRNDCQEIEFFADEILKHPAGYAIQEG